MCWHVCETRGKTTPPDLPFAYALSAFKRGLPDDLSEAVKMLYNKACPRCSGDIKLDRDNFGVYAKCLQCGFNRDFVTKRAKRGEPAPMTETAAVAELQEMGEQRREAA